MATDIYENRPQSFLYWTYRQPNAEHSVEATELLAQLEMI
jgi:hypothetical protein